MAKSGAKAVGRNRQLRVNLKSEVETDGDPRTPDLGFSIGVLSDLSGSRTDENEPSPLAKRVFVEIDSNNFNGMMARINPHARFGVPNMLAPGKDEEIYLDLSFKSLDDFSPDRVAAQVPALATLLTMRKRLMHLKSILEGKSKAEDLLQGMLSSDAMLRLIASDDGDQTQAANARADTQPGPAADSSSGD